MATYSSYTKTTSSTNKASTSIISSSSKTYLNKSTQFVTPNSRYIKNTLPISYQHNSLKTTSTITRCKPTSRYYTSTCAPSLSESNRLERNFSYIEAMKETKSLPSSSNSSSTSTIESPINETLQPQMEEVEIPIQIKLVETQSTLAKSRSQSSIFHLFRNTFSPFQIRKWRSKSRDKLLYNSSLNQASTNIANNDPKLNTTQVNNSKTSANKNEFILAFHNQSKDYQEQKDNNYSYTSSLSSNSSDSSYNKLSPKLSPSTNARQLSYLKLTCLLNGYDKNEIKDDKVDSGSVKSIYLKSSKGLCNERYYDVKPGFKRYTSSPREAKKSGGGDDDDGQMYKSELSVRLNLEEKNQNLTESYKEKVKDIEPIIEKKQESITETEKCLEIKKTIEEDESEDKSTTNNQTHVGFLYVKNHQKFNLKLPILDWLESSLEFLITLVTAFFLKFEKIENYF